MSRMARPWHGRRYIVRHADAPEVLFTVDAVDEEQALARAAQVSHLVKSVRRCARLVVEKSSAPLPVPSFLDGYFELLNRSSK